MAEERPRTLRLVSGGLDYSCLIGGTRLAVLPLDARAPQVDAVVVEQDTHGVLAVETEITEPQGSLGELSAELETFVPHRGGEVVVKRATPLQFHAIVHDLDQSPSWREAWIVSALDRTLQLAKRRGIKRLGMAPLGTLHGRFPMERFIELLVAAVKQQEDGVEQIWLGIKRQQGKLAVTQLKRHCAREHSES